MSGVALYSQNTDDRLFEVHRHRVFVVLGSDN